MKEYKDMLMAQLTIDREMLNLIVNCELEKRADVEVRDFAVAMEGTSLATVNGVSDKLISKVISTTAGQMLTIASDHRYYKEVDVVIPFEGELKETYLKVKLGQHLLDSCRLFINHPDMF